MKKLFFSFATVCTLLAFQSCSPKCGHCHREITQGTTTQKVDDATQCGDNSNESGSYSKAAEVNCKLWAGQQTPVTGVTYTSAWVADK